MFVARSSLREANYKVDYVDSEKHFPPVGSYDLVVFGSGIRADKCANETLIFLEKNAHALDVKKTALFVSCLMTDREEEEAKEKAKRKYLDKTAD